MTSSSDFLTGYLPHIFSSASSSSSLHNHGNVPHAPFSNNGPIFGCTLDQGSGGGASCNTVFSSPKTNTTVLFDQLSKEDFNPVSPSMRFRCPVCSKEFYNKYNFKCHYMMHSGEKPYECSYCPYRGRQASHLKRHVIEVHKIIPSQRE